MANEFSTTDRRFFVALTTGVSFISARDDVFETRAQAVDEANRRAAPGVSYAVYRCERIGVSGATVSHTEDPPP